MTEGTSIEEHALQTQYQRNIQDLILAQKPLFLVVEDNEGDVSPLLQLLNNELQHPHQHLHLQASDTLKPNELLQQLYALTDLRAPNVRLRFEDQLQAILNNLQACEQRILLFIENAHTLNFSLLAIISHLSLLQEYDKTQLLVVLSGTASLPEKMHSLQARSIPKITMNAISNLLTPEEHSRAPTSSTTSQTSVETVYNTSHSSTPNQATNTALSLFWVHHQVKTIAFTSLGLLISGLFFFNYRHHQQHLQRTGINYRMPQSSTIMIPSSHPLYLSKKATAPYYSIQLISSTNKKTVQRFIQKHHLTQFASIDHNKNHYTAIMGHFNTYQRAHQSLQALPTSTKQYHPWIRKTRA